MHEVKILVGTRKGAFVLSSDSTRRSWQIGGPIMLGNMVHHMRLDPRDGKTVLMAARTGHLGPMNVKDEIVIVAALSGG